MSKNLNKKLLAESFDACVNDNDLAKATRLFKRYWDLEAKNRYAILESADEDFEITDMGDDFNNEMADEIGSDSEEKYNQIQIAVDELEDKFPVEMTDEVHEKFDELRNIIDEIKLSDEEDDVNSMIEDATVAVEDLKGEFDMAGEMSDEITDLFDEITSGLQGDDEETEDVDVADEDDIDVEDEEEVVEESADEDIDLEYEDGEGDSVSEDFESDEEDLDADESDEEDLDADEDKSQDELVDEIKYSADELVDLINELEGEEDDKETVDESWSKISDPRKKMTSEEGADKKSMNFGKLSGMKMEKAGLKMNGAVASAPKKDCKVKVQSNENNGAKQWRKMEKPANKPASAKSLMGK